MTHTTEVHWQDEEVTDIDKSYHQLEKADLRDSTDISAGYTMQTGMVCME